MKINNPGGADVRSITGADDTLVVRGVIEERAGVVKMSLTGIEPSELAPRTIRLGMPLDEAFSDLLSNGWVTVEVDATAPFWSDSDHTDITYTLKLRAPA